MFWPQVNVDFSVFNKIILNVFIIQRQSNQNTKFKRIVSLLPIYIKPSNIIHGPTKLGVRSKSNKTNFL